MPELFNLNSGNDTHSAAFADDFIVLVADQKAERGTAVLIKNTIPYERVYTPSSVGNKIIEYFIVKIKIELGWLHIISLLANNEADHSFTSELNTLFTKLDLDSERNFFIIAGDFNARHSAWGNSVDKRKGVLLKRWADHDDLGFRARVIPSLTPSFPSAGSFLDLCLVDHRMEFLDLVQGKLRDVDYNSDHKALVFSIKLPSLIDDSNPAPEHRYMFKKTKWKKFKKQLADNYISSIPADINLSNEEISSHLLNIQNFIQ